MLLVKGFRLLLLLCLLLVRSPSPPLLHSSSLLLFLPPLLFRSFVRRVISLDLCVAAVSSNGVRLPRRGVGGGGGGGGNGGSGERRGHKSSARQKRDPSHRWKGERKSGREGRSLSCVAVAVMVMVDLSCIVSSGILDACLMEWAGRFGPHKVLTTVWLPVDCRGNTVLGYCDKSLIVTISAQNYLFKN